MRSPGNRLFTNCEINSKIVHFFIVGASIKLQTPTNYFEMVGLPHEPVFVKRLSISVPGQPASLRT